MKIATTTADFGTWCQTDEEKIRELHAAGFKYVDLSMYELFPDSPYMRDNWEEEVRKLRALVDELGMRFVQAHSPGGNPLKDDKAYMDFFLKSTIRSIEICGVLGIKNTVVHSGWASGITKEEWFEKNKNFYAKLFPVMEKYGVNVLCENSVSAFFPNMYYICNGRDMREFIDYVNHPQFHGCWDTGHGNCEGGQYDEIMAIGEHLYAIHYHDNRGEDVHVAPFLGTLNHDEVINALIDVGYKGYFTLESNGTLRTFDDWTGPRRPFARDNRLANPQLFMRRHIEKMIYETAEWFLKSYEIFEE